MQTLKATRTELLRVLLSYDVLRISYHPLVSLKILRIKRRMLFIFGEKSLITFVILTCFAKQTWHALIRNEDANETSKQLCLSIYLSIINYLYSHVIFYFWVLVTIFIIAYRIFKNDNKILS